MRRETNPCAREVFHGQAKLPQISAGRRSQTQSKTHSEAVDFARGHLWASRRTEVRRIGLDIALMVATQHEFFLVRVRPYPPLCLYNWHRPHGSLKAQRPISRLGLSEGQRVEAPQLVRFRCSPPTVVTSGST